MNAKNKILLVSVVAASVSIVAAYWIKGSTDSSAKVKSMENLASSSEITPQQRASLKSAEEAITAAEQAINRSTIANTSEPTVPAEPISSATPWVVSHDPQKVREVQKQFNLGSQVKTAATIAIDTTTGVRPEIGSQVNLTLPEGTEIKVNVENNKFTETKDFIWSGHVEGYGADYPVVMTYGNNRVYATITTPSGSYTMESYDGNGVIFKNPSEAELTKSGHTDYLEPNLN